jgi:hypothetical protein
MLWREGTRTIRFIAPMQGCNYNQENCMGVPEA